MAAEKEGRMNFILSLEPGEAEAAANALEAAGIEFDPKRQVTYLGDPGDTPTDIVTGGELTEIIEMINETLEYQGDEPTLPNDAESWSLEQTRAVLALIGEGIHFEQGNPEHLRERVENWEQAIREHAPHLLEQG